MEQDNICIRQFALNGLEIALDRTFRDADLSIPAGFCISVNYGDRAEEIDDPKAARAEAKEYAKLLAGYLRIPRGGEIENSDGAAEHCKKSLSYSWYVAAADKQKERQWAQDNADAMKEAFEFAHLASVQQLDFKHARRAQERGDEGWEIR